MIYPFVCDSCGLEVEVIRKSEDAGLPQKCDKCGNDMRRVYTPALFAIEKNEYFNNGLGVNIRSKSDQTDAIKKLRDGQVNGRDVLRFDEKGKKYIEKVDVPGVDIIEVGNEKIKPKKAHIDYNIERGLI